jgi:ROS/MUCR transcriptional regulator protein/Homing endonuclease associated repeat
VGTLREADHAKHVVIGGEILFYRAKAPYEASGLSIKGALEYDEEADQIKCHECGEFYSLLGSHVPQKHDMSAMEYKERHGLLARTALVSEGIRQKLIVNGKSKAEDLRRVRRDPWRRGGNRRTPEEDNSKQMCNLQVIERVRSLGESLGRFPTTRELRESGLNCGTLVRHFGSIGALADLAGLWRAHGNQWSRSMLLWHIKNFKAMHGRNPSASDCARGLIPNRSTFRKYFGGLPAAIIAASRFKGFRAPVHQETRIFPALSEKLRKGPKKEFWGVKIGEFAIGGNKSVN